MNLLADVLITSIPVEPSRPYTYRIPEDLVERVVLGCAVSVPFGRREARGFVVAFPAVAPAGLLRAIRDVLWESTLPPSLQALLNWVANHYLASLAQMYATALPPGMLRGETREKTQLFVTLTGGLSPDLTKRQSQVLGVLTAMGGHVLLQELSRAARTTPALLKEMEARGALAIAPGRLRRAPHLPDVAHPAPAALMATQQQAVEAIVRGRRGEVFLLYGVTGSGKTEVYIQAIAETLARGEQALVLVPEIALTPQTVARFRARFGDRIAVLHSALSDGERYDEWERIRHGEACVGIGARSAVFAPFPRLGLLVLDEEHEGSYKQDTAPRYHARTVALRRAATEGARLVLGSATPSLESYESACRGQYRMLKLPGRVLDRELPPVEVVDMREELAAGHRAIFSRRLAEALREHLDRGEQTILLMNRRGYASFVLCRSCGESLRCPRCAVALTYHREGEQLRCHYCDHRAVLPARCPSCQSPYIRHFGVGTQQVAEAAQRLLPEACMLRMDRDTVGHKDAHREILEAFARGDAQVLIGTQMVAKGLDLPNVTLVGVLAADAALNLPDFRAGERTFQLLTQVAGRAGRGEKPGRVIIQTYAPDNPSVVLACRHDLEGFHALERMSRQELGYPPFSELINLVVSAPEPEDAWETAQHLAAHLMKQPELTILGPASAPLAQLRGRHRVQILIKTQDLALGREAVRLASREVARPDGVRIAADLEPVTML